MSLRERAAALLTRGRYKNWLFVVGTDGPSSVWLQVRFNAIDPTRDGVDGSWTSRKWRLSRYMTDAEIVQTALKAVLTAEEHEAREQFTYDGHAIFGPHLSLDKMVELSKHLEVRS